MRRAWDRPDLVRACLLLLGAFMALSIWYLPDFIHVSFVLPFLLIPGASLLYALRSWSGWSRLPGGRGVVAAGPWFLALVVAGKCAANVAHAYASAPVRFETAFGTLRGGAATEQLFRAVRERLVIEPDGRRLLFSYPDDAWLYLALPAAAATRFSVLVPGFFPEEYVREVIAALRARGPGTVVVWIPLSADRVGKAVRENYELSEELASYRIYVRR
jgi:hypothetical protein